mgnify:CR=1 FL=1
MRFDQETEVYEFPLLGIHDPRSYPLAGRTEGRRSTTVDVNGVKIGDGSFTVIAGPCAVESYEQFLKSAQTLKSLGIRLMRGGAYKPRTSPYSFQGLHEDGIEIIRQVKAETGILVVTELMNINDAEKVFPVADIVQVGSRNMQNFPLLEFLGKTEKPILLKRGFGNTIYEFLMSAEYVMKGGNGKVILCERGIRTFDPSQRNTLDLMAVAVIKRVSHLPILVDPSHSLGLTEYIAPALKAGIAVGADGALVEVHPDPLSALSDGRQSLDFGQFELLLGELRAIAPAFSRVIR